MIPLAVDLRVWHPVADRNVRSYNRYNIHGLHTESQVSFVLTTTTDAHVEFHMQNFGSTTLRLCVFEYHWFDWRQITKIFTLEPGQYLPGEDVPEIVSNADNNHRELPRQLFFVNQDTRETYTWTLQICLVDPDERRVVAG
jgi:hypothetical protein